MAGPEVDFWARDEEKGGAFERETGGKDGKRKLPKVGRRYTI